MHSIWGYCKVGVFNGKRKQHRMPKNPGAFPQLDTRGHKASGPAIYKRPTTNRIVLENWPDFRNKT